MIDVYFVLKKNQLKYILKSRQKKLLTDASEITNNITVNKAVLIVTDILVVLLRTGLSTRMNSYSRVRICTFRTPQI